MKLKKNHYSDLDNSFISALKTLGDVASLKEIADRLVIDFDVESNFQSEFRVLIGEVKDELIEQSMIECSKNQIITLARRKKHNSTDKKKLINKNQINHLELLEKLKQLHPNTFERLCLRFLKELGFRNLNHTGKINDGGFDGIGSFVFNEIISFDVLIQAKRYQNTVGSSIVRDFRGAMSGRTEKGLLITTGMFSASALKEASRDGAVKIDLIDGQLLCEKMIDLNLGVKKKIVEEIKIDIEWFDNI